jgi:hypothetical protein
MRNFLAGLIFILAAPSFAHVVTATEFDLIGGPILAPGLYLWSLDASSPPHATLIPYVAPASATTPSITCSPALGVNWINNAWQCVTITQVVNALTAAGYEVYKKGTPANFNIQIQLTPQ